MRPLCGAARLSPLAAPSGGVVTPKSKPFPVEAGLLQRFLDAERGVEWRPVQPPPKPSRPRGPRKRTGANARIDLEARLAYFHDETARVEQRSVGSSDVFTVTSGPVGALVLIGESARRGVPTSLESRNAGELPEFPEGAIEARWDANARTRTLALPFNDLIELARYALA